MTRRSGTWPLALRRAGRLVGLLLILLPLVPLRALFGAFEDSGLLVPASQWLLGAAIIASLAWVLALPEIPGSIGHPWGDRASTLSSQVIPIGLTLLATVLLSVSWSVFRHRPLLVDSIVQLFQAKIFASGRISAPVPAIPAFFMSQHMLFDSGRWYSQYPPGHSALLLPGVVAGAPWLVPILLSLVSAFALHRFARYAYDESTGRFTLLLLVLCPFFWFMGASYMNHVSTLAFVALFLWQFAAWEERGGAARLAGAGACLGVAFLSRPYTAAAIAAVFAAFGLVSAVRSGRRLHLVAGALGFLALACLYPSYNALTTGRPFEPGYLKLWGPLHGLGFHLTPWGQRHTPLRGLRNELTDLQLLNLYLFEWPVPALWPLGLALAGGWLDDRWSRRLLAGFLVLPLAYLFYWHRDSYLGPRFLYAGLAFVLPLTARAVVLALRRLGGRGVRLLGPVRAVDARRLVLGALVLCFVWSAAVGIPGRTRVYATSLMGLKQDLPARVRAAGIGNALVFVKVDAGNRLMARLRGLGASASRAEMAYRTTDFCDLVRIERRARAETWTGARLDSALAARAGHAGTLVRATELNGDPTLRLRRSRLVPTLHLPRACADELAYDRSGYDLYTPHLLDNRPDLRGPLVVARDLRELDPKLQALYPDRPAYLYHRGVFERLDRPAPVTAEEAAPAGG